MPNSLIILVCLFFLAVPAAGQNQTFNWCFGDSAGIDFNNLSAPINFNTSLRTRGSCASVSDSQGNLLLYAFTRATVSGNTTKAYNAQHQLILHGDSIVGSGWYHEIVILPSPGNDSIFYIFTAGVTNLYGLYFSEVNMNHNGGLGEVIQKNVMVMPDEQVDCISAVKHGNGRDWWVVGRRTTVVQNGQYNNEYYSILVDPSGVGIPNFQQIGSINKTNLAKISFSPSGDTLLFSNTGQVIEYFQFDRCSGILSNPVTVRPPATNYSDWTWSNEFSSSGRFIYTSTSKDTTQLFQYDLQSPNPLASRVTLYQSAFPKYCGGDVKRAPDGKIYFSIAYENVVPAYPYPDSIYNSYNMNLSVINSPDSLGASCDFQPYSYYLGGKRTYYGLPNNPDYFLGPKLGSPCDTLTALSEAAQKLVLSSVYPNPGSEEVSINYFLPAGCHGKLEVYNSVGASVYEKDLPRFTYTQLLKVDDFARGVYLICVTCAGKRATQIWVKQ